MSLVKDRNYLGEIPKLMKKMMVMMILKLMTALDLLIMDLLSMTFFHFLSSSVSISTY